MKIKLDSSSEMARKIAMCYIGSCCTVNDEYDPLKQLIAVANCKMFVTDDVGDDFSGHYNHYMDIIVDTNTEKFDPFVAMREGISMVVSMGIFGKETGIANIKVCCSKTSQILRGAKASLDIKWASQQEGVTVEN